MPKGELLQRINQNFDGVLSYTQANAYNADDESTPPVPSYWTVKAIQEGVIIEVDFSSGKDQAHLHPNFQAFIIYGYRTDAPDTIIEIGKFSDSSFTWHPEESFASWMISLSAISVSGVESAKAAYQQIIISTFHDDFSGYGGRISKMLYKEKAIYANWQWMRYDEAETKWTDDGTGDAETYEDTDHFVYGNNSSRLEITTGGTVEAVAVDEDLSDEVFVLTNTFSESDYICLYSYQPSTLSPAALMRIHGLDPEGDWYFNLPNNIGENFYAIKISDISVLSGTPSWSESYLDSLYVRIVSPGTITLDDVRLSKADPDDATTFNDTGRAWDFTAGTWHIYEGNLPGEPAGAFSLGQIQSGGADICLATPPLAQVTNGKMSAGVYIKAAAGRAGLAFRIEDDTADSEDMLAVILDTYPDKIYLVQWTDGGRAEATENYILDPSFEAATLTTYWTNSGLATFEKSTTHSLKGSYSLHVVSDAAADYCYGGTVGAGEGGETWTASAYVYLLSGDCRLTIQENNSGWTDVAYIDLTEVNEGFERIEVTATLTAGVTDARIKIGPATEDASEFYVDCVQFEEKAVATDYCDGSLGVGHVWNGTANASASTAEIYAPETLDSVTMTLSYDTLYYIGVDFKDSEGENRIKAYVSTRQEKLFTAEALVLSKASDAPFPSGYGVGCLSWQCNCRFVRFNAGSPEHADYADKAGYAETAGGLAPMTCRYKTSAGQSIPDSAVTIIDYGTAEYDPNSLVTTGASWKFTAQKTGYYDVKAKVMFAATTNWAATERGILYLYKNGVEYSHLDRDTDHTSANIYMSLNGADQLYLEAGDYIDIRVQQNCGSGLALQADAKDNYVVIGSVYNP